MGDDDSEVEKRNNLNLSRSEREARHCVPK